VQSFAREAGVASVSAVCAGVAGPVTGLTARLTNVPWIVDLSVVATRFGGCPAALLNDLAAMAYSVGVLRADELCTLQPGTPNPAGNAAVIAAGTGMGQALMHNHAGRFVPLASEGGHADYAARTPREHALAAEIARRYGRSEVEHVLSGPGIVNVFRFTHEHEDVRTACPVIGPHVEAEHLPAAITAAALEHRCARCADALAMFVAAYGAESGNLALRAMATGGVFIGGGIAPKILPALQAGDFMDAFRDKAPLRELLGTIPVHVMLNPSSGLIGAAVHAAELREAAASATAKGGRGNSSN
jgi:glucokinase